MDKRIFRPGHAHIIIFYHSSIILQSEVVRQKLHRTMKLKKFCLFFSRTISPLFSEIGIVLPHRIHQVIEPGKILGSALFHLLGQLLPVFIREKINVCGLFSFLPPYPVQKLHLAVIQLCVLYHGDDVIPFPVVGLQPQPQAAGGLAFQKPLDVPEGVNPSVYVQLQKLPTPL